MGCGIDRKSKVALFHDIGLYDGANQIIFNSIEEQNSFFDQRISWSDSTFSFMRDFSQTIKISAPYESVYRYNYGYFMNEQYTGDKRFYFNITSVSYVSDTVTAISYNIDNFQTWQFDVEFIEETYVARETIKRSSKENILIPENFDLGSNPVSRKRIRHPFEYGYMLISTTCDLSADFGTETDPIIVGASGGSVLGMPTAYNYYIFPYYTETLKTFLENLAPYPWIGQCIATLTILPVEPFMDVLLDGTTAITINNGKGMTFLQVTEPEFILTTHTISIPDWKSGFPNFENEKLYSLPYSWIELSTNTGQQMILNPALLEGKDITLRMLVNFETMPRIIIFPENYNVDKYGSVDNTYTLKDGTIVQGDFYDNFLLYENFPTFDIAINQGLLNYASRSQDFKYSKIRANMNYNATNTKIQWDFEQAETYNTYGLFQNALTSAFSLFSNEVAPGLSGSSNKALQALSSLGDPSAQKFAGRPSSNSLFGIGTSLLDITSSIRDKAMSEYMNRLNKDNTINQLKGAKRDLMFSPPSVEGHQGGEIFTYQWELDGVFITWKTINSEFIKRSNDYINLFGVQANKFKKPVFKSRKMFEFIQTSGRTVKPKNDIDVPLHVIHELDSIYNQGVRLWKNMIPLTDFSNPDV